MKKSYDVIVLGLGGWGSAAAYHLAKAGKKTLGLEQFQFAHDRGASQGESRIFRYSQFAGPDYVPLAFRSKELWLDLEKNYSDTPIFYQTGGMDAGPEDGSIFPGALKSCQSHNLNHEVLSASEANARFPAFSLSEHFKCVYQPDAGILVPERGVAAHLKAAETHGADLLAGQKVTNIELLPDRVKIHTDQEMFEAESLVVTAGAWLGEIMPGLKPYLMPERGCVGWFKPTANDNNFKIGNMPIFIVDDGKESFYGFPEFGRPGYKIGGNTHLREYGTAEGLRRGFDAADEARLRHFINVCFPDGNGALLKGADCVWTLTPDEHFIIDTHPDHPNVTIAGGCSGYGYKFCPVIGEMLAGMVAGRKSSYAMSLFKIARLPGITGYNPDIFRDLSAAQQPAPFLP